VITVLGLGKSHSRPFAGMPSGGPETVHGGVPPEAMTASQMINKITGWIIPVIVKIKTSPR